LTSLQRRLGAAIVSRFHPHEANRWQIAMCCIGNPFDPIKPASILYRIVAVARLQPRRAVIGGDGQQLIFVRGR